MSGGEPWLRQMCGERHVPEQAATGSVEEAVIGRTVVSLEHVRRVKRGAIGLKPILEGTIHPSNEDVFFTRFHANIDVHFVR